MTMIVENWPWTQDTVRERLARHLAGAGIELGPGHQPFPLPFRGAVRQFVDRWQPEDNRKLFPELPADAQFPDPDVVCNLDTDLLRPIPDESQDFVIASHVLEHVANPLAVLDDVHRVLRPGGAVLLLLPDRHRTFDRDRPPTPLEHLIEEHRAGVVEVSDEHMLEFLELAGEGASYTELPADPTEHPDFFDWHRKRSIHVHCWDESEFPAVLIHATEHMGHRWELVDGIRTDDEGRASIEFGYVLQKSLVDMEPADRAARFDETWRTWFTWRGDLLVRLEDAVQQAATAQATAAEMAAEATRLRDLVTWLEGRVAELDAVVTEQRERLDAIHATSLYRAYRATRSMGRRLKPTR